MTLEDRRSAASPAGADLRLPDFIIGGAPKCGTTSLHFVLAQHPSVGIPEAEIHYFDADDPITHPDFLFVRDGRLDWIRCAPDERGSLDWYASRFAPFEDRAAIGEDSTTYLFSAVAARRMRRLIPEVRLVFMLRDPAARAYSQYWHLVKTSRATCSFEHALARHPALMLGSTYAPHLREYFDVFGRDRVHVELFEDYVADPQAAVDRVTRFLGLPGMTVPPEKSWFNRTVYPSNLGATLWINRIGQHIVGWRYANHLGARTDRAARIKSKLHYWWFAHIMPRFLRAERPPAMREETRRYLAEHLSARNAGLSDLLGRPLGQVWRNFTG
jgi:hypothetical protein